MLIKYIKYIYYTHFTYLAPLILCIIFGTAIGLVNYSSSGPLWPDAPRYANAALMINDWIGSGSLSSPLQFALHNYAQYPSFNIPYHPPGYPFALAVWFNLLGCSYLSARLFIALCWGLCGWMFYLLSLELKIARSASVLSSLILLSTPQIAAWARDTMSEIPSILLLLTTSFFWIRWLDNDKWHYGLLSLVSAELAFMSRITTIGIVPGLLLFSFPFIWKKKRSLLIVIVFSVVFLITNSIWLLYARGYSVYEFYADGRDKLGIMHMYYYFSHCILSLLSSSTSILCIIGLVTFPIIKVCNNKRAWLFWSCWLFSYVLFKTAVPTSNETRHFITGLIATAGFSSLLIDRLITISYNKYIAYLLGAISIIINAFILFTICPSGVVGYNSVGKELTSLGEGNVLLACWEDQDVIFHIRTHETDPKRYCIRSDRTLSIRTSNYAKQNVQELSKRKEDVVELIKKGKIKYILSCEPDTGNREVRTSEMLLVHQTMKHYPDVFELHSTHTVTIEYMEGTFRNVGGKVFLWKVRGHVTPGKPDINITIPTAGLQYKP